MRKLLIGVIALGVLLIAAILIVASTLDPNDYRDLIAERASEALGRPVRFGEMSLDLLPLPSVEIRDVHVGPRGREPDLADVERLRLRISPLPLLARQVVLRSVVLEGATLRLAADRGIPRAPELGTEGATTPRARETEESAPFTVAISGARVTRGTLIAGPWRVDHIDLSGRLEPDLSARLDLDADVEGIGGVRDFRVRVRGLREEALEIDAEGRAEQLDLASIDRQLGLGLGLAGRAQGPVAFALRRGALESLRANLDGREVALRMEDLHLAGDLKTEVVLGERFALDLTDAAVEMGDGLRKPRGDRLRASGKLGRELPPQALREVELLLPDNRLLLDVELSPRRRVSIADGPLRLEPVLRWMGEGDPAAGGTVGLQGTHVGLEPLTLDGGLALEDVELPLERERLVLTGTLRGQGTRVVFENLVATVAGQTAAIEGNYDLAAGELRARTRLDDAQVQPLVQAFSGKEMLSGLLDTDLELSGPPDLERMRGSGTLTISPGEITNFSLVRQLLGQFASVPLLVAQVKGKDLSRYQQERFERLATRFRLAEGLLHLDPLELIYEHAQAELSGSVRLSDLALDLRGQVVIGEALDRSLFGEGKRRVIPIQGIRGTLDAPRVLLDAGVVTRLAASAATTGRLGEKLDERLGAGASETVRGVLDSVLGGGARDPNASGDPRSGEVVRGVLDILGRAEQRRAGRAPSTPAETAAGADAGATGETDPAPSPSEPGATTSEAPVPAGSDASPAESDEPEPEAEESAP